MVLISLAAGLSLVPHDYSQSFEAIGTPPPDKRYPFLLVRTSASQSVCVQSLEHATLHKLGVDRCLCDACLACSGVIARLVL